VDDQRVTSFELFFDLVFVFTITQLASFLARHPTGIGLAEAAVVFGNLWWMFGGYAWLTNSVPPRTVAQRLLILLGMAAFLVVALAAPDAFGAKRPGSRDRVPRGDAGAHRTVPEIE
jgi:low temperature requirement protein LtrA